MTGPSRGDSSLINLRGKILASAQVPAAETTVYTVPAGRSAEIKSAHVINVSGSGITVDISVVKSGATAGVANRVYKAKALATNTELDLPGLVGVELDSGDFISINPSAATALDVLITGLEFG